MNRAFLRGLLSEFEKQAKKAKAAQPAQQPQMMMMPAIPPEVLAALMGEPEPEYEDPSMLQMLTPSIGLGAAGLGVGAAGGLAWPKVAPHMANLRANIAARAGPLLSRMNPMRMFGKRAMEKAAVFLRKGEWYATFPPDIVPDQSDYRVADLLSLLSKSAGEREKRAMAFLEQKRPRKVKEIYSALKREHPGMPAEMKARIAARQGKPGKQKQGPPYKGPLTKAAKKEEKREDPSGYIGLMLKAMRRVGKGRDPRMLMAMDRLARNIPTDKRPY